MLEFLAPVEHFGRKFDRGSVLYEFSALREPEATQFPHIGAWLRAKGVEFNEVPTPQMLWRGKLWPDLFIANQLDALADWDVMDFPQPADIHFAGDKSTWNEPLSTASRLEHGRKFHETFIEPLCRKITGRSSSEIAAKHHRCVWVPLYWPQTLRSRQSIPTPFFYPCAGWAGSVAESIPAQDLHGLPPKLPGQVASVDSGERADTATINTAFVVASPRSAFSVCFVVDESPIYRVTDQDVCAGTETPHHRLIVEYRGECDVWQELVRLGFVSPQYAISNYLWHGAPIRMTLPTLKNVSAGWTPRPHINAQLLEVMANENQ